MLRLWPSLNASCGICVRLLPSKKHDQWLQYTSTHQTAIQWYPYCVLSWRLFQPVKLVDVGLLYVYITAVTNTLTELALPKVKLVLVARDVVRMEK